MRTIPLDLVTDKIALPKPVLPACTLDKALKARQSVRSYASTPLSFDLISALLWAAFGINRHSTRGRTAPSAHDWQETDIYSVVAEGCYRYNALDHSLDMISAEDLRAATGLQDFVITAPLNLVYVTDFDRMSGAQADERKFLAAVDAGCIAQNVNLYCAAAGLATVVRGLIDRTRLAEALRLSSNQHVVLAQSVGHFIGGGVQGLRNEFTSPATRVFWQGESRYGRPIQ
jgi:SagB-type dehydrogenase family enzyme